MNRQFLEKDISKAVINFLEALRINGELTYYVNLEGAKRDIRQQVSMKRQGARAGRPDIEVFTNDNRVLFLELKRKKGGRLTQHQCNEIADLQRLGFECHVVRAESPSDGVAQIAALL